MRQQGSDGAKLRQPHHTHDQATATRRSALKDVAFTTPAHDQESEDIYVVDR